MSRLSPNKLRNGLAALAFAGAIASGAAGMASHAVWASDMEISRVSDQGTRYVRIGLNKSVVVHLPAAARDVLKQLGIDTAAAFSIGKFALGWASVPPFTANANGDQTSSALGLGYGNCGPNFLSPTHNDACGVIRAMERDGILRTLAEPTL